MLNKPKPFLQTAGRIQELAHECVDKCMPIPSVRDLASLWKLPKSQVHAAFTYLQTKEVIYKKGKRFYGIRQLQVSESAPVRTCAWRVKILYANLYSLVQMKDAFVSMANAMNMECDEECFTWERNMENAIHRAIADNFHALVVMPPFAPQLHTVPTDLIYTHIPVISTDLSNALYRINEPFEPVLDVAVDHLWSVGFHNIVVALGKAYYPKVQDGVWVKHQPEGVKVVSHPCDTTHELDSILEKLVAPVALILGGSFVQNSIRHLVRHAKKRKWRISRDIAFCGVGSSVYRKMDNITPSYVWYHQQSQGELMACLTFSVLQLQSKLHGKIVPSTTFYTIPKFNQGNSTPKDTEIPEIRTQIQAFAQSAPTNNFLQDFKRINSIPFSFAQRQPTTAFVSYDLRDWANRPYSKHHGWFGDIALPMLRPGLIHCHGVPFMILDESANHGNGVVVLRCARNRKTSASNIPQTIRLPLNQRVRALYFLHACGYADVKREIARYTVHTVSKRYTIPLISTNTIFTDSLAHYRSCHDSSPECTITDWYWPDVCLTHPSAKTWIVYNCNEAKHKAYSLCVYEWIHPNPELEIESIEICTRPEAPSIIALMGLTMVK